MVSRIKISLACASLSLALAAPGVSASVPGEEELQDLLSVLDEQTQLATKTRLNKDHVPGLVTVLHAEDLRDEGLRTVWQALERVPGLQLVTDEVGNRQVVVRGIGRTFASGNVKLMLNGVALNSAITASADPLFEMPLGQVERIEIIRGPGSAVHGEFAFMGVINVLTGSEETEIAIGGGTHDSWGMSAVHSLTSLAGWHVVLNAATWRSGGQTADAGEDSLFAQGLGGASYAPGPANDKRNYASLLLDAHNADYRLLAQVMSSGKGDHFGINLTLPPPGGNIITERTSLNLQVERRLHLVPGHASLVRTGFLRTERDTDEQFVGPAVAFTGSAGPDIFIDVEQVEHRYYAAFEHKATVGPHDLLADAGFSWTGVERSTQALNLDPVTFQPTAGKNAFPALVQEGITRRNIYLTLQDQWRLSDPLSLTSGIRFDHYDDVDNAVSPRVALVYRINERNTLKAQYAHAFRPPTFLELAGAIDSINPVDVDSFEFAYTHRWAHGRVSATGFYHRIRDLIVFLDNPPNVGFDNVSRARSQGAEVELALTPHPRFSFDGSVSLADTRDEATGKPVADSTRWMFNLAGHFNVSAAVDAHLSGRYVGARERDAADPRGALEAYTTLDFGLVWRATRDLTARLAVRNLNDADVRYPAPFTPDGTYPGDFPQAGRSAWLEIVYRPAR